MNKNLVFCFEKRCCGVIRKPIVTVMGHVDSGKTLMLDSIRGTKVVDKEAGGITQHIGATEVPLSLISELAKEVILKYGFKISVPGLLFIDTPGHEAFTNLRKRGGSIADIAVLVVDVHKGLQDQTIEAIEILKSYKCPFVVAINKIDTIKGWVVSDQAISITDSLNKQSERVLSELDEKVYKIVGELYEKGFQSERFDRVKDFTKEVALIPVSAKAKIGLPELLSFLAALSQKYLEKKLRVNVEGECKGTILEVKEEKGLGKTIDVIIYDGMVRLGDELVVGGKNGVIRARVKALLEPKPIGSKSPEKFRRVKEVHAAAGVKIVMPNLDDALSGAPVRHYSEENAREIMEELQSIKIESGLVGPIVRSNTLGSLEAIIKLLKDKGISVNKADVGEVIRKDVLEAEAISKKNKYLGVVFAFHTRVTDIARQEAKKRGVFIFENDVVYRLLEEYDKWVKECKEAEKRQKLSELVLPAKLLFMNGFVFRNSSPAIIGVKVLEGKIRKGVQLMKKGVIVGRVLAIQQDGKNVDVAHKGMEVAISIDDAVVGKSVFEGDELFTFIPRKQFVEISEVADSLSIEELELVEEIKKMEEAEIVEA